MLYVRYGMRTLVIDADTFHSALSEGFGANTDAERKADRDERSASTSSRHRLRLRSVAERRDRITQPARHQEHEGLLADLHDYDIIIVDMPPLTSGADRWRSARCSMASSSRWNGARPGGLVTELARTLQASKASLIGVLLTKVRFMSTRATAASGRSAGADCASSRAESAGRGHSPRSTKRGLRVRRRNLNQHISEGAFRTIGGPLRGSGQWGNTPCLMGCHSWQAIACAFKA